LHPPAQATQRELAEQAVEIFQHRPQAARSLGQHDLEHIEVLAK